MTNEIIQLFPTPAAPVALHGLYLNTPLLPPDWPDRAFVYSNFVTSIDGRIALADAEPGQSRVPDTIANPRDWRLFQELAAQADILLCSGNYLRELAGGIAQAELPLCDQPAHADLLDWRQAQGLPAQPDVAVFSNSLDIEVPAQWFADNRRVYILTTTAPDSTDTHRLQQAGATVQHFASAKVGGAAAVEFLAEQGYRRIYSVGGPYVFQTLLADGVLDTLFLTTVHRLVGDSDAPGILEGSPLPLPLNFHLRTLYYDTHSHDGIGQTLARYDRIRPED